MREMCLLVLILFLANWCLCCCGCLEEERIALLKLKENINYTKGSYFSSWVVNETSNCCQWQGIICSNTSRRVTELSISVKSLVEKDEFGVYSSKTDDWGNWHFNATLFLPFKNLKALLLRGHALANWTPNEGFEKLKQLRKLEKLDLAGNNFNRSIFLSLSQLTSLKSLNLGRNNIGSGNERLTGLSNLEILDLRSNNLNDESVLSALELNAFNTTLKKLDIRVGNSEKSKVFTFGWEYVGQELSTEHWCNVVP